MDIEDDVDGAVFSITGDLRLDLDKGVAAVAQHVGDHRDRVLELLRIVPIARLQRQ